MTVSLEAKTTNNAVKDTKTIDASKTEHKLYFSTGVPYVSIGGTTNIVCLLGTYEDGVQTNATAVTASAVWSSSDNSLATVSGGTVTGMGKGTVTISAVYDGMTATGTIDVYSSITSKIVLSSTDTTIDSGYSTYITATYYKYGDSEIITSSDVTSIATWTSGNTSVATVGKGVITGVAGGSTTITVSSGGATASINVTVLQTYTGKLLCIGQGPNVTISGLSVRVQSNNTGNFTLEGNWGYSGNATQGAFCNKSDGLIFRYDESFDFNNLNPFIIVLSGLNFYAPDGVTHSQAFEITPTVNSTKPTKLIVQVNVNISTDGKITYSSASVILN